MKPESVGSCTDNWSFQGSTPALFVGTTAFEVIVKQQIKRLEDPSLKCCQLVYDELIRILGQLLSKIVSSCFRWVKERICHLLRPAIFQAVSRTAREIQQRSCELLQDCHGPDDEVGVGYGCVSIDSQHDTWKMGVDREIRMQACYVNTTHPDFLNGHKVRVAAFMGVQARVNDSMDRRWGS